jgi:SAM-dependent methyltransferase
LADFPNIMKNDSTQTISINASHTSYQEIPDIQALSIERGETQRNVNKTVLDILVSRIPQDRKIKTLDLPCGNMLFLGYLKHLFPYARPTGADIMIPAQKTGIDFVQMDLTKEFELPREEQFDVITSISGVMMFNNTLSFIENCTARLRAGGTLIVTNDNSMTLMDRVRFMLLGRVRMFNHIYEDDETMTQNVPVSELIRLLRKHDVDVEDIQYTSFYKRDLFYLPLALLIYPLQFLYLLRSNSSLASKIRWKAYPFKHLLCRHYVITGKKRA